MSIEYEILKDGPLPFKRCPRCKATPFQVLLRGEIYSLWRKILGMPYCAVICIWCKSVVGYELRRKEVQAYESTAQGKE